MDFAAHVQGPPSQGSTQEPRSQGSTPSPSMPSEARLVPDCVHDQIVVLARGFAAQRRDLDSMRLALDHLRLSLQKEVTPLLRDLKSGAETEARRRAVLEDRLLDHDRQIERALGEQDARQLELQDLVADISSREAAHDKRCSSLVASLEHLGEKLRHEASSAARLASEEHLLLQAEDSPQLVSEDLDEAPVPVGCTASLTEIEALESKLRRELSQATTSQLTRHGALEQALANQQSDLARCASDMEDRLEEQRASLEAEIAKVAASVTESWGAERAEREALAGNFGQLQGRIAELQGSFNDSQVLAGEFRGQLEHRLGALEDRAANSLRRFASDEPIAEVHGDQRLEAALRQSDPVPRRPWEAASPPRQRPQQSPPVLARSLAHSPPPAGFKLAKPSHAESHPRFAAPASPPLAGQALWATGAPPAAAPSLPARGGGGGLQRAASCPSSLPLCRLAVVGP